MPEPAPLLVVCTQDVPVEAVQPQLPAVVTEKVPLPLDAATLALVGLML